MNQSATTTVRDLGGLSSTTWRRVLLAAALGASVFASACVPLAVTGVAVGALAVADRRTLGAQTDDQSIELKALGQLKESVPGSGGVSVTSFNRRVLLTGQVADEDTKSRAERAVAGLANVRGVHNELQISGRVGIGTSTVDVALTARVKAAMIEDKNVDSTYIKIVTEAGVVYLMGLVSRAEGDRAAQAASKVSGVTRVVTVYEYLN